MPPERSTNNYARLSTYSFVRVPSLKLFLCVIAILLCSTAGYSQDWHKFTADIGGGVSPLTGAISNSLDTGWNFAASAGYNFTDKFSTSVRYTYNGFGINRTELNQAAVPDGSARLWSVTLDPKIRFASHPKGTPYIVGGVGYFRRTIEFTQPTTASTILFDPFFGFFFPAVVPVNQVIGTISRSGIGGNAGAGLDFGLGESGLKLFAEARYQYADTGRVPTRMIPITFGLRW